MKVIAYGEMFVQKSGNSGGLPLVITVLVGPIIKSLGFRLPEFFLLAIANGGLHMPQKKSRHYKVMAGIL